MMRILLLGLLALAVGLAACQPEAREADNATKQPPRLPLPANDSAYCRQEILDPDFGHMVAFTLKVPRHWSVTQTVEREWFGTAPHVNIRIALRSPDGRQQIEYFPSEQYVYTEHVTPQLNQMPPDSALAPMTAVAYLRTHWLPLLAAQNLALRDTTSLRQLPAHREKDRLVTIASLDGRLPNRRLARAEVRFSRQSSQRDATIYHGWSAVPSLTQAATDLPATYAHTQVAQQSIVPNSEWLRLINEPVVVSRAVRIDGRRIPNWYGLPLSNTRLYYQHHYWRHRFEEQEWGEQQSGHHFRPQQP